MLGLFGTLTLGVRSLQAQQQGTEVAGHNLANVNNPAYSRQRLSLQTSLTVPTAIGPQGTGVEAGAITQLRDVLVDHQIQTETSVRGSLDAQQSALQFAQANLGQMIDTQTAGAEGAAAAGGVGGQHGIAEDMSDLFNAFKSVSSNPTSLAERQVLMLKAQNLSNQFNLVSQRMSALHDSLNLSVQSDVTTANVAIADIAKLNQQILAAEVGGNGKANDLRDIRQQRIEDLSKLVKIDTTPQADGAIDISIAGASIVAGPKVADTLQAYDAGGGQYLVRTTTGGVPLALTGGALHGTITARDGALQSLRANVDTLAGQLISQVNSVHAAGYSLSSTTGAAFFTGTDAASIAVNNTLLGDPSLIQASGTPGTVGDNQTMVRLGQLANTKYAALNNQTFSEHYNQTVAAMGQDLSSVNTQLSNQQIVQSMLQRQRDAVSGVSLDEEMTDLMKYQKAFAASAKLIVTVDEMLDTVVNLKR